jgi:cytochrome P450
MKQFGWLYTIFTHIPELIVGIFHPLSKQLFGLRLQLSQSIKAAKSTTAEARKCDSTLTPVFTSLIQSPRHPLPPSEISSSRLTDEGLTLLGAGTVTTAQTLSTTLYFVLSSPEILSCLVSELQKHISNDCQPTWTVLSQLPYLTAVINEGLRLSYGVSHRLPRIAPDRELQLGQWTIPRGTPVSMTQMFIHEDPNLFPDPLTFKPERWLTGPDSSQASPAVNSKRFFLPFSKGTRGCLGTNLAWAELYLCLVGVLRLQMGGTKLQLYMTDEKDVRVEHDYFNPAPARTSVGVRILLD